MTKNVYIHIPFCRSKCHYCSFVSFDKLELKDAYVDALKKQIRSEYKGEKLNTLYFGGGTPSLLAIEDFMSLISLFNIDKDAEITVEMNPEGLKKDYLIGLRLCGVNRISIGSQSFDDGILKLIGRRHTSAKIKLAVKLAKEAGFENISLDLIYGLPTQTMEGFVNDLDEALNQNVQHISLYGLKIEEGCYFSAHMLVMLPDLDTQADMYLKAVEKLTPAELHSNQSPVLNAAPYQNCFEHYEISNFAKSNSVIKGKTPHPNPLPQGARGHNILTLPKEFQSKHNLNYWDNNTYYGFGLSASGYIDKIRYTNELNLENYIANPLSKNSEQKLTENEILEEEIFLGLRKISGISVEKINKKFNIDFEVKYKNILDKYLETGHLIKTQNGYTLSIEGVLVSNEILSEFIN